MCLRKLTNALIYWLRRAAPCGMILFSLILPPSSDFESVLAMDCNGLYVCRIVNANVDVVLN